MRKSLLYLAVLAATSLSANGSVTTTKALNHAVSMTKTTSNEIKAHAEDGSDAETWKNIGKATWVEGPSDAYASSISGKQWTVDVEESQTTPGRYRMIPYGEGSALSDALWFDCDEYFYVNTQNADKVYCEDYEHLFFAVSQLVPENGWQDVAVYGSVEDKVISFPAKSFGLTEDDIDDQSAEWVYSNVKGNFKIFLPGAAITDYSFSVDVESCGANNMINIECTSGNDIATVKVKGFKGLLGDVKFDKASFDETASAGTEISTNGVSSWTAPEAGKHTLAVVALDAKGRIQAQDYFIVFTGDDNADRWETLGTAQFTDPIIPVLGYTDKVLSESQTFDVTVERNKSNSSLLRIVDPYVNHPFMVENSNYLTNDHNHHHYIYIDITDPEYVVVSESPTGVDLGCGQICINSPAYWYGAEHSKDDIKKYYGSATYDSGIITFPPSSLFGSETREDYNTLYRNTTDGLLVLPDAGVDTVVSDDDAEAVYYNLQGMAIDKPQPGQLVICRKGKKVTKIIF